jgi:putative ABC transport system permease protein
MRELFTRFLDLFRRDKLDRELNDEIAFHKSMLEREERAAGAAADDAAHAARRRLGNVTGVREQARETWSFAWVESLTQDLRYAFRGLRRSPGFTAAAVTTLGLGIGANAAMFGVIDRLMFRPLPYLREPAQVQRVYLQTTSRGRVATRTGFPYTTYTNIARWSTAFSDYAAFTEWRLAIGTGDAAREHTVAGVSSSFFKFFDAKPAVGRYFDATEDSIPRGENVGVLSYGYWKSELGGRDVIGTSLSIGALAVTIIGVAPDGFVGVSSAEPPAVFIPITTLAYGANQGNAKSFFIAYNWDWMSMMVRRKPGVSLPAATADLTTAFTRSMVARQEYNRSIGATWGLQPVSEIQPRAIAGSLKTAGGPGAGLESQTLLWVTGVAAIVLLIACANVTNLMFARVLRRRREIAVRLALGVSRRRLIAQFLTESVLLAFLGCAAGIAIAQWGGAALRLLVLPDGTAGVASDGRTLAVAASVALVAGVLIAIAPAMLAVRGDLTANLRAGAREGTSQRSRMRSALLVLQGTLSVILLVGAGLFVRSLDNVRQMHMGWDAEQVLVASVNLRGMQLDSGTMTAFRREILATAQAIPAVQAAARINADPFGTNTDFIGVEGIDSVAKLGRFNQQWTTPDYFKTVDTRIVRGRAFTNDDRDGGPLVAVVSESMGRTIWPGRDPIGQCMRVGFGNQACTTVIGIAEDAVQGTLADDQHLLYYLPMDQKMPTAGNRILIRVSGGDVSRHVEEVRRALQKVMPGQAYVTVAPLQDEVDTQRRSWQLGATMFVAFGLLALFVAAVGLYGVISYNVAQRMHELGVRVALGAQPGNILGLVVGQGMKFALAGIAIGTLLALAASAWIQPLLFKQSAKDPIVYATVGAILFVVAIVASTVPALRAAKADPNVALRSD